VKGQYCNITPLFLAPYFPARLVTSFIQNVGALKGVKTYSETFFVL